MSTSHTTTKLNCAYIYWEIRRTDISQIYSGWGNSVNFRNSSCAAIRVEYAEMSTVQCVANTLLLTLEQDFDRFKSFECVIYIYVDQKVLYNISFPTRSCFSITARKNHCGSVGLRDVQYRVSIVRALVHLDSKCIREVIAFASQIYGSYPIHGFTHVILQHLYNCRQYQQFWPLALTVAILIQ